MQDKVIVLTGGSSAIDIAEVFESRGSKMLISGRNQEALVNVFRESSEKEIGLADSRVR